MKRCGIWGLTSFSGSRAIPTYLSNSLVLIVIIDSWKKILRVMGMILYVSLPSLPRQSHPVYRPKGQALKKARVYQSVSEQKRSSDFYDRHVALSDRNRCCEVRSVQSSRHPTHDALGEWNQAYDSSQSSLTKSICLRILLPKCGNDT